MKMPSDTPSVIGGVAGGGCVCVWAGGAGLQFVRLMQNHVNKVVTL